MNSYYLINCEYVLKTEQIWRSGTAIVVKHTNNAIAIIDENDIVHPALELWNWKLEE